MSLFGPICYAKAQPPRSSVGAFRHPQCTAPVTVTSLRLEHGHRTGSKARTPASTGVSHSASQPLLKKTSSCRPPKAGPPPKTPRPGLISHPIIAIKTAPPMKPKGDSARTQTPGPTGDSGGRSVSAPPVAQSREYARASSPARSVGRGPGKTATPGGGAHLGHGHLRLQARARPRAVLGRRPRLTCGLSSRVSSMGSLSIPGIVAKAGRRQDTRQPPTAPRAAPPAAADPVRPLLGAAAPAQELSGRREGNPASLGPLAPPSAHPLARCNVCQRYGAGQEFLPVSLSAGSPPSGGPANRAVWERRPPSSGAGS